MKKLWMTYIFYWAVTKPPVLTRTTSKNQLGRSPAQTNALLIKHIRPQELQTSGFWCCAEALVKRKTATRKRLMPVPDHNAWHICAFFQICVRIEVFRWPYVKELVFWGVFSNLSSGVNWTSEPFSSRNSFKRFEWLHCWSAIFKTSSRWHRFIKRMKQ